MTFTKRALALLLLANLAVASGVPGQITYQGTLKESGVPVNATRNMLFRITNSNGTTVYWSSGNMVLPVTQGLFSTVLVPTNVPWDAITPYIEISVEGQLLTPREPVTADVYSLVSQSIVDGAVSPTKLDPTVQNMLVPPGAVMAYAGATPPAGWLPCDGSAVSRSTYAALFQAIGIIWGAGNSASTFNLPDMRGRSAIGLGQGPGLTNRTLGDMTIGEEVHVLTVGELPAHNHGVNDPGHFHESSVAGASPWGGGTTQNVVGGTGIYHTTAALTSKVGTGISIANNGGGSAHNTMPPSAVTNYIIKY